MKKTIKRFAAALCAGILFSAAPLTAAAEEITLPSGMTVDEVRRELENIDSSGAVGIFKGDSVLYTGYFGMTDTENSVPTDENAVYEWGSISKTFIWVSAMQLYEEGRLELDRDVREYLPDGFFRHLTYDEPITMLDLMNHKGGWQETTRPVLKNDGDTILPLKDELQAIEPAQIFRPNGVAAYSNYGAAAAAYVIECITGQDYCEYVREHIFEPLGMEHTALAPDHSDNTWVQEQRKNMKIYKTVLGNTVDLGICLDYIAAYPAGAATGTLDDLMTYAQALVNENSTLFHDPKTRELMFTGTDFYGDSDIPICAHGFWCTEYAVRTYGHTGATTAGQAVMLFDLESKTGFAAAVNCPDGGEYVTTAPTLVFGELSPDKYASGTPEIFELSSFYIPSRSTHKGMLKLVSCLTAVPAKGLGDLQSIGSSVCEATNGETAMLMGIKNLPDGSTALSQPSADLLPDRFHIIKLCLLTLYILSAVAAVYLLRIRHKLKRHGKLTSYKGAAAITAGQTARIVSVTALLLTYTIYVKNQGGVPLTASEVIGVIQMLCAAVCTVSAVASLAAAFSGKSTKYSAVRNIMNTLSCILPVIAIVYFEMYMFRV